MRLKDKVAVVTGGAKGIGACIAQLFAREGAQVIACDMNEPGFSDPNVAFYKLDVSDSGACKAFFDYATSKHPKIDILVNNAGITQDALTRKMTDAQWNQVIDVNLNGIFYLTRHIGPFMQAAGSGSIINISSVVGEYGNIGQANYAATKSAIFGLTKTWAKEFAMKGGNVRTNAIAPGYIMTDILKTVPQDLLDKFASQTMLGRLGEPEEIANAALFLAGDESIYITGQTLSVNGGMRL
ncbi:MAG: 3-oxoacyl-ACP reductase FabG [Defluviitaleaceae bacterium]|nr:3-oxoacyl-ACP reductase FabG [Defluviitaleaceae bacterium]MCL2239601.1 3-oxoacyl-ACP reductase FabG [Defluviitaleaceae bacterium]